MSSYCELGISEWKELESLGHERLKNDGDGGIDEWDLEKNKKKRFCKEKRKQTMSKPDFKVEGPPTRKGDSSGLAIATNSHKMACTSWPLS